MIREIVEARPLEGRQLFLRFDDGTEGVVDVEKLVRFEGVFEPLRDREQFHRVRVELGTVCWPGGADLDPLVLYAKVTGKQISFAEHGVRFAE